MEKYKESNYNHFITLKDGKEIVFNTMTFGLAVIDPETKKEFEILKSGENNNSVRNSSLNEFIKGGLLIPENANELDIIKSNHYMYRFSTEGLGLTILPTMDCNFRCKYCYQALDDMKANGLVLDMTDEVQENILKFVDESLKDNSVLQVTFYGGEPLLNIERVASLSNELTNIVKRKKGHYSYSMVSNGFLLNQKNVEILTKCEIKNVQITLDGSYSSHDKRRPHFSGISSYETIINNLTSLVDDPKQITVAIRVNIDKENINGSFELLQDLKSRNLHQRKNIYVYPAMVRAYTSFGEGNDCLKLNNFSKHEYEFYKMAFQLGFNINFHYRPHFSNCGAINPRSFVIQPDGSLHKCWTTVGLNKYAVGKLTNDGVKMNNIELSKWIAWNPFEKNCEKCKILAYCMGGCPQIKVTPELLKNSNYTSCNSLKNNLNELIELHAMKMIDEKIRIAQ
jgi:uncharacterized protein